MLDLLLFVQIRVPFAIIRVQRQEFHTNGHESPRMITNGDERMQISHSFAFRGPRHVKSAQIKLALRHAKACRYQPLNPAPFGLGRMHLGKRIAKRCSQDFDPGGIIH